MTSSRSPSNRREAAIVEIQKLVREHSLTREDLIQLEPKGGASTWERQRRIAFEHCRQMVDFWNIAPSELRGSKVPAPKPKSIASVQIKYRHPVNGATWDGQGSQPDWLKQALLKEGYTVRELKNDKYVECSEESGESAPEHSIKEQTSPSSTTWA